MIKTCRFSLQLKRSFSVGLVFHQRRHRFHVACDCKSATRYFIDALKLPIVTNWYPWYGNRRVGGWSHV
ncbi:unnamed protein product [Linum trigynum]|uniref:Uncharacterized protein n=1 Tax=Linum trigynum TaxID=586398 RepID=A0AAV2DK24_9ROSI